LWDGKGIFLLERKEPKLVIMTSGIFSIWSYPDSSVLFNIE